MTTTRAYVHNQTGTIIKQQHEQDAVISTASELAAVQEVDAQLSTARSFNLDDIMSDADDVVSAHKQNEQLQADGLAALRDTLATTNIGARALSQTMNTMQSCVVISEAIALEDARYSNAVVAGNAEQSARIGDLSRTTAEQNTLMDDEVALRSKGYDTKRFRRSHDASVVLDEFMYDHELVKNDATQTAAAVIQDAKDSVTGEGVTRNAAIDRAKAVVEDQRPEVLAAEAVLVELDDDIESATNSARSKAISETTTEGKDNAAIMLIEQTSQIDRMKRHLITLVSEAEDLVEQETSLFAELSTATAELKALNTAAVGGQANV